MSEFANVIEAKEGKVKVKMYKNEACKHCHACDFGSGAKEIEILAVNECQAKTGDTVELFIKKDKFLKAVSIMYVLPLISLLLGVAIGYLLLYLLDSSNEILPFTLGLAFTIITFLSIKKYNKDKIEEKYTPIAIKVIK